MRSNVDPKLWGKDGWGLLFSIAHGSKERFSARDVQRFNKVIDAFAFAMPCADCREHFARLRAQHPMRFPDVGGKDDMFAYVHSLFTHVNTRLGKPTPDMKQIRTQLANRSCGAGTRCGADDDEGGAGVVVAKEENEEGVGGGGTTLVVGASVAVIAAIFIAAALGVAVSSQSRRHRATHAMRW